MRSPRKSADEQYALVIECRSSGLSDHQWCMQHDINPGTFYNWVKRLRKRACYDIPAAVGRTGRTPGLKQDVVKVDIIPDIDTVSHPNDFPSPVIERKPELSQTAPIEIRMHETLLRITNDVDPRLLAQILRTLGGCVC